MENYLVGIGRVDITPDFTVSLGGYGNYLNRHNDVTLDPLYATCVAITDETIALMEAFFSTIRLNYF